MKMNFWFIIENNDEESILVECSQDAYGDVVLPNGITHIAENAFNGCNKINSLTIPNSIQRIGLNAFEGCTSLNELVIPKAYITIIGGKKYIGSLILTAIK